MSEGGCCLLMIAARAPWPGETKTRLGRAIGMDTAAVLYRAFLRDIAATFNGPSVRAGWDVAWTYSPPHCDFPSELASVTGDAAPPGTLFVPQDGPDWAVRQANLLRWGRQHGYRRVVLMASDSPHLEARVIDDAFDTLARRDVVLGRVRDGGYYLIGVAGDWDVLSSVQMSTSTAADGVVESAGRNGLSIGEIRPTFDIDEVTDLAFLEHELRERPDACPATRAALSALGLVRW